MLVKKTVLLCRSPVKHFLKVPCFRDITALSCEIQCNYKLPCGHLCEATCHSCQPSHRSLPQKHQQCAQPCNKSLSCNHKCPGKHMCQGGSLCPPCLQSCPTKCAHKACPLPCGVPCIPCNAPCTYSCPHMVCQALCGEPHRCVLLNGGDIAMIEKREGLDHVCNCSCTLKLMCGHNCMGVCGEKCPKLCVVCKSSPRLAQNDVIITLSCGHTFEEIFLHESIIQPSIREIDSSSTEMQETNRKVPSCPTCRVTIQGVYRYSSLVRDSMLLLTPDNMQKRQEQLCLEVIEDPSIPSNKIQNLLDMMVHTSPGRYYHGLKDVIALMLGKLYLSVKNLPEANKLLGLAKGATSSRSWVSVEASICLGYMHLGYIGGIEDGATVIQNLIEGARMHDLEKSLKYFEEAHDFFCSNSVSSARELKDLFDRESSTLLGLLSSIDDRMDELNELKKVAEADAIASMKIITDGATRAALDPIISPIFPAIPPQLPLPVAAPTHNGSLLHIAAGVGSLPEVKSLHQS